MSLRVATAGLELMADALRAQGVTPTEVAWRPPAGGEPCDDAPGEDDAAGGKRIAADIGAPVVVEGE